MKKKIIGKIIILLFLLTIFLFVNKLLGLKSFGADEEKTIVESNLEKYINYNFSEDNKGTLVQYNIKAGIEYGEEYFPIKNSELAVNLNKIDDKFPNEVKVIAKSTKVTNGKTDKVEEDYSYDGNTGKVVIRANNENENGEAINNSKPNQEDRDEYILICYYDTYSEEMPLRNLEYNVEYKTTLFTEDNKEVRNSADFSNEVTENIGDIVSITSNNDEVYGGYIKSNIINNTTYGTSYNETQEVMVSKKDASQRINILSNNSFVRMYNNDNGNEIVEELGNKENLMYKTTKIYKQDVIDLLGEQGKIEILDSNGNVLATIDQNTEYNEQKEVIITYPDNINDIYIRTSDIVNEGILRIENEKEIKSDMHYLENVKVKNVTKITGVNLQQQEDETTIENEVFNNEIENIVDIKSSETNVEFNISNTEWTNKKQNEITFDISLNSASLKYNLFKDPTLRIELPSQVEKVILGDSSIVYANGLTLNGAHIETQNDGTIDLVVDLTGSQTGYDNNNLGLMTNIEISATVILKKDIESTEDSVNLVYTNHYDANGNIEQGNIEKAIQIENYNETQENTESIENISDDLIEQITEATNQNVENNVITASAEDIEGLKVEVETLKGDTKLNNNDTLYEGEYLKYNIKITNTLDKNIDNVKIVGSVPEGLVYGELNADYYSYNGVYEYNFDEELREKEINIETISVGETVTKFYEVKVNDLADGETEKQITTDIKTFIGASEVSNYETNNIIKPAVVQGFVGACLDNLKDRWNYNFDIKNPEGKEVTIKLEVPEYYEIDRVVHGVDGYYLEDLGGKREGNIFTLTVKDEGIYSFQGLIPSDSVRADIESNIVELKAYGTLITDGTEYKTNENRIEYTFEGVSIAMTSENEGEEVRYGETIDYRIAVTNIGRTNYPDPAYNTITVNVKDYLPEYVDPISMTYEYYPIANTNTGELDTEKTTETKEISGTLTDANGNELADVELSLTIPYGETLYIDVHTTAGYVYERTVAENSAIVEGETIVAKTSNIVSHIILPANEIGDEEVPDEPTDPSNPENPNNPDEPNNPGNSGNERYNISGLVWNDKNEDGSRQNDEPIFNGIEVMLVDMNDTNNVKAKVMTNSVGSYAFSDLETGNYIVVFRYDTSSYSVTEYQKGGVSYGINCDAKNQTITLNGEKINVGVTDTINLIQNATNIDLGLIENKTCDVQLDKYISSVTVETNKGTKQYSYDKSKLAKIEIKAKEIEGAVVTIKYDIVVTNNGELPVTIGEIEDTILGGLEFSKNDNLNWVVQQNGKATNKSLMNQEINSGESKQVSVSLTKTMTANDTGTYTNNATIKQISNQKGAEDSNSQNNSSQAQVIISISTGLTVYILITIVVIALIALSIFLILKFKIKLVKVGKLGLFVLVFAVVIAMQTANTLVEAHGIFPQFQYTNFTYVLPAGSHQFTGGPDGGGGWCMNHENEAYNGTYYVYGCSDTSAPTTNSDTDTSITINKGNSTVGMKQFNGNYILGPFQVTSSVNIGYTWEVYDQKGNGITGYAVCDENGNNILPIPDYRNVTFYITIPADKMKNGVSRVRVSQTRTGTRTTTTSYYGYLLYHYNGSTPKVPQDVRTKTSFLHDQLTSSSIITNTQAVEWTAFDSTLDIIKQDADDSDVKLSGVQIHISSDNGFEQILTTDENGRIHLDNVPAGIYQIEEYSNDHYGYTKLETEEVHMYSGMPREFSLANEKQTGNLQIIKRDQDIIDEEKSYLEDVEFKIMNTDNNYVVGIDSEGNKIEEAKGVTYLSNMETTQNEDEATTFITDNSGKIEIHNILIGTYRAKETYVGDKNYGYEADDNYTSWETDAEQGTGAISTIEVKRARSYTTVPETNVITDDKKTLGDGMYEIETALNSNSVIEITSAYTYDGANVALYQRNNSMAQKFYLRYQGSGWYTISAIGGSNKVLDVQGASTALSTRVQLYTPNGGAAQKWRFIDAGNGYYYLQPQCNSLYLDVKGAVSTNKTPIQVYTAHGGTGQKFKMNNLFETSDDEFSTVTINNKRKYVKFSGVVWEDMQWSDGKELYGNELYFDIADDINDKLLQNVVVVLRDLDGNLVPFKDANGNELRAIQTDINGKYELYDVEIDRLGELYIEFIYNGMCYQNVKYSLDKINGNRAGEGQNRVDFNNSYTFIAQGSSKDENRQDKYDLSYETENYKSYIIYNTENEANLQYGYEGQKSPIYGTDSNFLIASNTRNAYLNKEGATNGCLNDVEILADGVENVQNDTTLAEEIRMYAVEEVGNINLGLIEREQPDLTVIKDLKSATVTINGQERIYEYNDRFNTESQLGNKLGYDIENLDDKFNDVGVAFEEKYAAMSYTRALYASDIMYNDSDASKNLDVRVTYKIGVKNSATGLNARIYELQDYFDSKYDLVGVGLDINDDGSIKEGTEIEEVTSTTYNDDYKKMTIKYSGEREGEALLSLEPLTDGYVYVELRVMPEHLIDIINVNEVKLDNITEITEYGTTKTIGTENDGNLIEETYAGIDRDSQPGNLNVDDRTTWEDDTDKAPGLKLVLQEARTVSGQVFEDNAENQVPQDRPTDAGEVRQGNGHYDEGEKGIENVEVRLINTQTNDIQQIWTTNGWVDAITYADSEGKYTIEGFIPGDYRVEYVWGDNTYRVQDYKSTIVGQEVWDAKENNDQWYKDEFKQTNNQEWNTETNTEIRNSDAVDDYDERLAIDGTVNTVTYGSVQDLDEAYSTGNNSIITKMTSSTTNFRINIEYDTNTSSVRDEYETDENGVLIVDEHGQIIPKDKFKNNISSVDFGIVERSRQVLQLSKYVTSARIALADGNVLVNAKLNENGELQDFAKYVTAIPNSSVNGQLKIEIDQEIIQGATLEVEYGLEVRNISEVEYQTQDFYMYGKGYGEDETKIVTLEPDMIIDYLNKNMATDSENDAEGWEYIEENDFKDMIWNKEENSDGLLSEDIEDIIDKDKVFTTESLGDIILKPIGSESETTAGVVLKGYRLLSNSDEDFLENNAEIIQVTRNNGGASLVTTPGNYVPSNSDTYEEDDAMSQNITVSPPTGLISDYIAYVTLAISSLGILISGIILIKKYVLGKNRN